MAKCEFCGKAVAFGIRYPTHTGVLTELGSLMLKVRAIVNRHPKG